MNIFYQTETYVTADVKSVWDIIKRSDFVHDFFPEIKKRQGKNQTIKQAVLPSYAILEKFINWTHGSGLDISLQRNDLQANIESIEIGLEPKSMGTKVKLKVIYAPNLDKDFIFVNRCVRELMKMKLAVLKQDVNNRGDRLNGELALAY